jgi:hypothetical protein
MEKKNLSSTFNLFYRVLKTYFFLKKFLHFLNIYYMHIKHVVFSIIVIKIKIMFMLIIAIINIDKLITSKLLLWLFFIYATSKMQWSKFVYFNLLTPIIPIGMWFLNFPNLYQRFKKAVLACYLYDNATNFLLKLVYWNNSIFIQDKHIEIISHFCEIYILKWIYVSHK